MEVEIFDFVDFCVPSDWKLKIRTVTVWSQIWNEQLPCKQKRARQGVVFINRTGENKVLFERIYKLVYIFERNGVKGSQVKMKGIREIISSMYTRCSFQVTPCSNRNPCCRSSTGYLCCRLYKKKHWIRSNAKSRRSINACLKNRKVE